MRRSPCLGFSLLEMLAVILIIGIIAGLLVPAASGIVRGTRLTQATQTIMDELGLARQTAIAKNRLVEVRLYQYSDPESPASSSRFRAVQTFQVVNSRWFFPLDKVQPLPTATIVDSAPVLSSVLDPATRPPSAGTEPLPVIGINYQYVAVRFHPDGSTDLLPTGGPWFLTLHDEVAGDALKQPPPNFSTIEIDPVNGSLHVFRP
jgi:uncharacterized protein (TIGR02596 family)